MGQPPGTLSLAKDLFEPIFRNAGQVREVSMNLHAFAKVLLRSERAGTLILMHVNRGPALRRNINIGRTFLHHEWYL